MDLRLLTGLRRRRMETPEPASRRGAPVLDAERCTGERACEEACPSAAITLSPVVRGRLLWRIDHGACVYCGRCREVCPADAIELSEELVLAARRREEMLVEAEVTEARPRRPPAPGEWYRR